MKLLDTLVMESIDPKLKARSKDDLFREMAALLKRNPALASVDEKTILKALVEREKTATTGVGREVAIPHGKLMGIDTICGAIGVARHGIEYDSVDGLPVRYVVAIVAPPEQPQAYLRVLAKVARLLSDASFTESLVTATSAEGIFRSIEAIEGRATPVVTTEERQLLIFELTDPDYFDAVVEYFTEVGATSATVLDARNVEGFLTRVPLFADFARVFSEGQEFGYIFLLVIDRGAVDRFIEGIEDLIGDLDEEGRGIAITLDIHATKGRPRKLEF